VGQAGVCVADTMISVIIPVGDGRLNNLRCVMKSLEWQTEQDFEVIISSDGSDDFAEFETDRVIWVRNHSETMNLGAVNRNRAVEHAGGDCLVFIDSDVVLEKHVLEYFAEDFLNFPNRGVAGLYDWLPPQPVKPEILEAEWESIIKGDFFPAPSPYEHNVGGDGRAKVFESVDQDQMFLSYPTCLNLLSGNMMISRFLFEVAGGFAEDMTNGIDGEFSLRLLRLGFSMSMDKRIRGYHLYHKRTMNSSWQDPRPILKERYHSDNSWIGQMKSFGR